MVMVQQENGVLGKGERHIVFVERGPFFLCFAASSQVHFYSSLSYSVACSVHVLCCIFLLPFFSLSFSRTRCCCCISPKKLTRPSDRINPLPSSAALLPSTALTASFIIVSGFYSSVQFFLVLFFCGSTSLSPCHLPYPESVHVSSPLLFVLSFRLLPFLFLSRLHGW